MPLTAAEKQYRYRQRKKEQDYEAVKESERKRWHLRNRQGKIKTIQKMTPREQRQKRRMWKKFNLKRKQETVSNNVPDDDSNDVSNDDDVDLNISTPSSQQIRGRKRKRKDRSAAYRTIALLEKDLNKQTKDCRKYRRQVQRLQSRFNKRTFARDNLNTDTDEETPRKKARKCASYPKRKVRRILTFHYAMIAQLKERYSLLSKQRHSSQILGKLFGSGSILKKYRKIEEAKKAFGLSIKALNKNSKGEQKSLVPERSKRAISQQTLDEVMSFYLREDISRPTAGKNETITRKKQKKQKHFLLDSIHRSYKIYRQEHPASIISLASFRRLRPFWVVIPHIQNRETCLCKLHENVTFMHIKLKQMNLLSEVTPEMLLDKSMVCSTTSKECMYRSCKKCMKQVAMKVDARKLKKVQNVEWWWQWRLVTETLSEKQIKKTKKVRIQGTIMDLIRAYNSVIDDFMRHVYNINNNK